MLYFEDFMEGIFWRLKSIYLLAIEPLPEYIQTDLLEIKHLDEEVQSNKLSTLRIVILELQSSLEIRKRKFFENCKYSRFEEKEKEAEYESILKVCLIKQFDYLSAQEYDRMAEYSKMKIEIADSLRETVYIFRCHFIYV